MAVNDFDCINVNNKNFPLTSLFLLTVGKFDRPGVLKINPVAFFFFRFA